MSTDYTALYSRIQSSLTKLFITEQLVITLGAYTITVFGLRVPYSPVDILILSLMWRNHVAVVGGAHHIEIVITLVLLIHVHIWAIQFLVMLYCVEQICEEIL
jgi:hypothetical protein